MSSHLELTPDYIPKEYYDTYRLVFTHYHIDKIIVRIRRSGHNQHQTNEDLPRVTDVLDQLVRFGTVLTYPEGEIDFKDYRQCPIKTLQVNICSTETNDLAVLHMLYSQMRDTD